MVLMSLIQRNSPLHSTQTVKIEPCAGNSGQSIVKSGHKSRENVAKCQHFAQKQNFKIEIFRLFNVFKNLHIQNLGVSKTLNSKDCSIILDTREMYFQSSYKTRVWRTLLFGVQSVSCQRVRNKLHQSTRGKNSGDHMPREDDSAPRLRTRGGSSSNTNCSFLYSLFKTQF